MTRIYHRAKMIREDGAASALCSKTARAINLRVASWTLRDDAVTCPRCRALLATASGPQGGAS